MASLYMLDTNTVSHLIKRQPQAIARLLEVPMRSVCISAITAGELAFGLAKRPQAMALREAVIEFLRRVEVMPWMTQWRKATAPCARRYIKRVPRWPRWIYKLRRMHCI